LSRNSTRANDMTEYRRTCRRRNIFTIGQSQIGADDIWRESGGGSRYLYIGADRSRTATHGTGNKHIIVQPCGRTGWQASDIARRGFPCPKHISCSIRDVGWSKTSRDCKCQIREVRSRCVGHVDLNDHGGWTVNGTVIGVNRGPVGDQRKS